MKKVISLQKSLVGLGLYDRYYEMYYEELQAISFGWRSTQLKDEIERFSKLKEALSAFGKLNEIIIIDKSLLGKTNSFSLKKSFEAIGIYDELMEEYINSFVFKNNYTSSFKLRFEVNDKTLRYRHLYAIINSFRVYNHDITLQNVKDYKELKDNIKAREDCSGYKDKIDAFRWTYGYMKPPKRNFRVFQESYFCNFTELWNDTFSTSLEAKRKIVSLKDKFKEGTKLSIFEVKEEYTIETEVKSFNKLKRI